MKAQNFKIFVGDVEIGSVNSWSFDTFASEADKEKARKEIEDMYVAHEKERIKNDKKGD